MNKEETMKILRIIHSVFPGIETDDLTVSVWQSLFPEPFDMVAKATRECLRNSKYQPRPADIIEQMHKKLVPTMTGEDAWEQIHDAYMSLRDESDYRYAEKLHSELPKMVRRLITPHDLIDYAFHMKSTDIRNYERPRIVKAFDSMTAEAVKMEIGSKSVQEIAADINKQIGLHQNNLIGAGNGTV